MPHPLKSLIESRPVAAAPLPPLPAKGVVDVGGDELPAPSPTIGFEVSPGFSILAIQDPPSVAGVPGAIMFASHLSQAEWRALADNLAWFDRADQRGKPKANHQKSKGL